VDGVEMAVDRALGPAVFGDPVAMARDRLAELEERLGYRFADRDLLDLALTHISAAVTREGRGQSYQRLEFLGDHVLGLVVSDMLYRAFPQAEEGELSRRLADLVRQETCAEVARDLDMGAAMRLGGGEVAGGGRQKTAILADVCEAVIGAVFLDGGYRPAADLIARLWTPRMARPRRPLRDAKTALQEWAQSMGLKPPSYSEVSRSGPDHSPSFVVRVDVEGYRPCDGQGRSKRVAEQAAAEAMLVREGAWNPESVDG
jgi:ribonuclease III